MNGPYPIKCARVFAHGRVAGAARHDQDVGCGDVVKTGVGVKRQAPGVISDRTFGFGNEDDLVAGDLVQDFKWTHGISTLDFVVKERRCGNTAVFVEGLPGVKVAQWLVAGDGRCRWSRQPTKAKLRLTVRAELEFLSTNSVYS